MTTNPARSVEARLLAAYHNLARRSRNQYRPDQVSLADLRDALPGLDRDDIDAALDRLAMDRRIELIPEVNRKILTRRERDAALHFGGEDRHYLTTETTY